ncbi:MAG: hypothetical protein IPM29_28040 [Planctomycetes bacterium]|nr:hypothetical protein [Planctomycetota bacterium]
MNVVAIARALALLATAMWILPAAPLPAQDRPPEPVVIALQHARADQIEPALQELLQAGLRDRARELRVAVHPQTNALIAVGPEELVAEAQRFVAGLDVPVRADATADRVHVVQLRHAVATELEGTLRNFLRETYNARRQTQTAGRSAAQLEAVPVVVAHAGTNSLLISATELSFTTLAAVIEAIDRPDVRSVETRRADERPTPRCVSPDQLEQLARDGATVAITIVALERSQAGALIPQLRPFASFASTGADDQVVVGEAGDGRSIMLMGPARRLVGLVEMIAAIDATFPAPPVASPEIRVFRLQHVTAEVLQQNLRALCPSGVSVAVGPRGELVVRAGADTLADVAELVEELDVAPHAGVGAGGGTGR